MKFPSKAFLRSIRGQCVLLGGAFLGAIALSVAAILLRGVVFEPYVREKYPAVDARTELFLKDALHGIQSKDDLEQLIKHESQKIAEQKSKTVEDQVAPEKRYYNEAERRVLAACHGYWMTHPDLENRDRILAALLPNREAMVLACFRQTLVVGNREQKLLALDGVKWLNRIVPDQANRLLIYSEHQARQRRETEILNKCAEIRQNLEIPIPVLP